MKLDTDGPQRQLLRSWALRALFVVETSSPHILSKAFKQGLEQILAS